MLSSSSSTEEISKHYQFLGDSTFIINEVIAGNKMKDESDEDKKFRVNHNVEFIESIINNECWTNEDMTEVNQAIINGKEYIG
jgi:hypothetical protein